MEIQELVKKLSMEDVESGLLFLRAEGEKLLGPYEIAAKTVRDAHVELLEIWQDWSAEMDPEIEKVLWERVSAIRDKRAEALPVYQKIAKAVAALEAARLVLVETAQNFRNEKALQ